MLMACLPSFAKYCIGFWSIVRLVAAVLIYSRMVPKQFSTCQTSYCKCYEKI